MEETSELGRLGISLFKLLYRLGLVFELKDQILVFPRDVIDPLESVDFLARDFDLMLLGSRPESIQDKIFSGIPEFPDERDRRPPAGQEKTFVRYENPGIAPSQRDDRIRHSGTRRIHVVDRPGAHLQPAFSHSLLDRGVEILDQPKALISSERPRQKEQSGNKYSSEPSHYLTRMTSP